MKKNGRRIFAWIGIILLAGMYVSTLVFALIGSPASSALLMASIVATLIIPVLLHIMIRAPYLVSDDPWHTKSQPEEESKDSAADCVDKGEDKY